MSSHPDVSDDSLQAPSHTPQLVTLGWALRRTALWLAMMFAMIVIGAWLYNAGIDLDEAAAGPAISGETTQATQ